MEVVEEELVSYEDDFLAPAQSVEESIDDYDDDFLEVDENLESPLGDAAIQVVQESAPQTVTRPSSAGPFRPQSAPRRQPKNIEEENDRVDALFAKVEALESRLEEVSKTSSTNRVRRQSAPLAAETKQSLRLQRKKSRTTSRRAWRSSSSLAKNGPAVGSAFSHVRAASNKPASNSVFVIGSSPRKSSRRRRSGTAFTYDPDTGHRVDKTERVRKLEIKKQKICDRREEPEEMKPLHTQKKPIRQQPIGYPTTNIAHAAREYVDRCQTWKSLEQQTRYARQIYLGNFKGAAELEPRPPPVNESRVASLLSSVVPQHRREHRKLREWDVLVTVEARPNVGKQMSTRHDPTRYTMAAESAAAAAIAALSRFRVRAASLVEVSRDSDKVTASRVGALEVQLAICTANGDIARLVVIHSKLKTRRWPTDGTIKRATHRAMQQVGAWETVDDSNEASATRHDDVCVDWTWVFDQRPPPRTEPRQVVNGTVSSELKLTAKKPRPNSARPSYLARDAPVVRLPRPESAKASRSECNALLAREARDDQVASIRIDGRRDEGGDVCESKDEKSAPSEACAGATGDACDEAKVNKIVESDVLAPDSAKPVDGLAARNENDEFSVSYNDDFEAQDDAAASPAGLPETILSEAVRGEDETPVEPDTALNTTKLMAQNGDDEAVASYCDDFEAQDADDTVSPVAISGPISSQAVESEHEVAAMLNTSPQGVEESKDDVLSGNVLGSPESPQNLAMKYKDEIETVSREIFAAKSKQRQDGAEIADWFEQHDYNFLLQYVGALVESGWGTLDAFEMLTEDDVVAAVPNIKAGHVKVMSRIAKRMREVTSEMSDLNKDSENIEKREEDVETYREAICSQGGAEFLRGYAEKSASFLSVKSLKRMLKDLGFRGENEDAFKSLLVHVDLDGDGMIRVEDATAFASGENKELGALWGNLREVVEKTEGKYDVTRLDQQLFKKYDKNESGEIPVSRFDRAITKLCSRSTAKVNVESVGKLSVWGDETVDYVAFSSWLNPVDILRLRRSVSRWLPKQLAANQLTEDLLFDTFLAVHGGQLEGALTQSELAIAIRANGLDISDADARALRINYSSSSNNVQDSFSKVAWSNLVKDVGGISKKRKKSTATNKTPTSPMGTPTSPTRSSSSLASLADLPKM